MLKLNEVYLKTVKEYEEEPDGSKKINTRKEYLSRECLLNPEYIVAVYDHELTSSSDISMLTNFPENSEFCRVVVDGNSFRSSEFVIAMSFHKLEQMLK